MWKWGIALWYKSVSRPGSKPLRFLHVSPEAGAGEGWWIVVGILNGTISLKWQHIPKNWIIWLWILSQKLIGPWAVFNNRWCKIWAAWSRQSSSTDNFGMGLWFVYKKNHQHQHPRKGWSEPYIDSHMLRCIQKRHPLLRLGLGFTKHLAYLVVGLYHDLSVCKFITNLHQRLVGNKKIILIWPGI